MRVDAKPVQLFHTRPEIGVAGPHRRFGPLVGKGVHSVVTRFDIGQIGAGFQRLDEGFGVPVGMHVDSHGALHLRGSPAAPSGA